jgi:hypothetical protein
MSIETISHAFDDTTGKRLEPDVGWVLVRRNDGREVAHFLSLAKLAEPAGAKAILDASWRNAQIADDGA